MSNPISDRPTAADAAKAAAIIASCSPDRLPYVLSILKQGGYDLDELQQADTDAMEVARLLNHAINDRGMSASAIAKLTGLQTTQITRIRTGASVPNEQRARVIISAIEAALSEPETK